MFKDLHTIAMSLADHQLANIDPLFEGPKKRNWFKFVEDVDADDDDE